MFTNSKKLQAVYDAVVLGDSLATYAVFEVTKNGVTAVAATGTGSLSDFLDEFSDGIIQFGFSRVTVPGSDVSKNILLGWCPDNAPAKLRLLFAANFAEVARVFSGYHVQITARDFDDLDPEEFLSRVGNASGARYTAHTTATATARSPAPKPVTLRPPQPALSPARAPLAASVQPTKPSTVVQPAFGAKPSFGRKPPLAPKPASKPAPAPASGDGWGGEKEIEERDFLKKPLEDVPSAYKPTKVNIAELRSQKSDTISSTPKPNNFDSNDAPAKPQLRSIGSVGDGRLSSLPKPKVRNAVASRYTPSSGVNQPAFGSKPAIGSTPVKNETPAGVYQVHGNKNGLTPAQLWAQKRGKYKVEPSLDELPASEVAGLSLESDNDASDEKDAPAQLPVQTPSRIRNSHPRNIEPILPKRENVAASRLQPEPAAEKPEEEAEPAAVCPPVLPSRGEALPAASGTRAVAQYDYEKDEDNEVDFVEGDVIVQIDFVDEEWWSGKNLRTGEVGVFPASYVALEEVNGATELTRAVPEPAAAKKGQTATAEYDYEKEEENELSFNEGDLIVEIEFVDLDWWSGKHSVTGEVGVFPGNYVKLH